MNELDELKNTNASLSYKPGEIHWDDVALQHKVYEVADQLSKAVVTNETATDVKKQLAYYRNYIKSTEAERIRVKQAMMKPINELAHNTKTLLAPLNKAIDAKKDELNELDEQRRAIKENVIFQRVIVPICESRGLDPNEFPIQHKWTNKTMKEPSIVKEAAKFADLAEIKMIRNRCKVINGKIVDTETGEQLPIEPRKLTITYFGDAKEVEKQIMNLGKLTDVLSIEGELPW